MRLRIANSNRSRTSSRAEKQISGRGGPDSLRFRSDRKQRSLSSYSQTSRSSGSYRFDDIDPGRNRERQGISCTGHSQTQQPTRAHACQGQLLRDTHRPLGKRVLWSRKRGVHRSDSTANWPIRTCPSRNALPGRGRGHSSRVAAEIVARPARKGVRTSRWQQDDSGRCPARGGNQCRPRTTGDGQGISGGPVLSA